MRRAILGTVSLIFSFVVLAGSTPAQAVNDHLKCYKVKDPLVLKGPKPSWLDLTGPDFGTEQCRIIGGFRLVCVPVTKTVTQPIQRKFSPPGGTFQNFTPSPFAGEQLDESKLCYKISCTDPFPAPPNPLLGADDQFGSRSLTKLKPFLLCGPAHIQTATVFDFNLDQAQETPPNGSTATGHCTLTLDASQTSLTGTCTHDVVNPTLAHIHKGAPGVAGGIVFGLTPASPINVNWTTITPADVTDLLAGLLYVNVHSANCGTCGGGEIRGQIVQ